MKGQKIGYVRVSTTKQNPDHQLQRIELDRRFVDTATGKKRERPALNQMLSYVRSGDELHVEAIDRLARSLVDLHNIVNELVEKGVTIKFHRENLVFGKDNSAEMLLRLNMMGAIAEFERNLLRERQKAGILVAKKHGLYKGRQRVLQQNEIDEIKRQIEIGVPKSIIAKRFGCSRQTIYNYLGQAPSSNP